MSLAYKCGVGARPLTRVYQPVPEALPPPPPLFFSFFLFFLGGRFLAIGRPKGEERRADSEPGVLTKAHANALGMPWFSTKIISVNYTPPHRGASLSPRRKVRFLAKKRSVRRRFCSEFSRFRAASCTRTSVDVGWVLEKIFCETLS